MNNTYTVGNHTLQIIHDDSPDSPRYGVNSISKMICFHRRYDIGDMKDSTNNTPELCKKIFDNSDYISLPIYMYEHSGITINTTGFSCPFDSGKIGIIYADKKIAYKYYNIDENLSEKDKMDIVYNNLKEEVKLYDTYLSGEVYGFEYTFKGDEDDIDSCWGFYGDNFFENGLMYNVSMNFSDEEKESLLNDFKIVIEKENIPDTIEYILKGIEIKCAKIKIGRNTYKLHINFTEDDLNSFKSLIKQEVKRDKCTGHIWCKDGSDIIINCSQYDYSVKHIILNKIDSDLLV